MYRVMDALDTGHVEGDVVLDDWRSSEIMEILERKGRIKRIESPPLCVLPGWQTRHQILASIGVETVDDFLMAKKGKVIAALNHKTDRAYRRYRRELLEWMKSNERTG
jgi:hypothetical protein